MGDNEIYLRPLEKKDSKRMLEWMRNEDVTRYLNIGGKNTKIEDAQSFIISAADESINLHRAIVDENDTYLGTVSLKNIDYEKKIAEYAISLHMDAIGTGVAAKATKKIWEIAKNIGLKKIILCVNKDNIRAISFYKKCGYHQYQGESYSNKKNLIWFYTDDFEI